MFNGFEYVFFPKNTWVSFFIGVFMVLNMGFFQNYSMWDFSLKILMLQVGTKDLDIELVVRCSYMLS